MNASVFDHLTAMTLISGRPFFLGGGGDGGDIGKQCRTRKARRLISFLTVCLQSVLFKCGEGDEK